MFLEHNSNIMIEFQVLLCFENIMFRRFGEKARYSPIIKSFIDKMEAENLITKEGKTRSARYLKTDYFASLL